MGRRSRPRDQEKSVQGRSREVCACVAMLGETYFCMDEEEKKQWEGEADLETKKKVCKGGRGRCVRVWRCSGRPIFAWMRRRKKKKKRALEAHMEKIGL